jgi:aspartokinase-like uncharacterized kinase
MATVVKVGGSLYDWPMLGEALRGWLATLPDQHVLLIPGGGATADAIRDLDRTHRLGDEASHWLALSALSVNARFLQRLLPRARIIAEAEPEEQARDNRVAVLDPYPYFAADEKRPDHMPHTWQVTSDSLAVRAAVLTGARELVLLKSVDWPGSNWPEATRSGVVDEYFATSLKQASDLCVRVVNLRTWLTQPSPAPASG